VSDYLNNTIQKFDINGNYLGNGKWSCFWHGQFRNPDGIVVDGSGNVYVADTGNNRVQKFDASEII